MRTIIVEPEQLESCAARMDQDNQDYERAMKELFAEVDNLSEVWKGKDNQALTAEIMKLQGDFQQLSVLCSQYSEFLKSSARAYCDTQDEIAGQAANVI